MNISRRRLFAVAGTAPAAMVLAAGLRSLYTQSEGTDRGHLARKPEGYGPLKADPQGILDLPAGFQYRIVSYAGMSLGNGFRVPGAFDGMAAFADRSGNTVLIRNHELRPVDPFGVGANPDQKYDSRCKGGTTTVVIAPDRTLVRQHVSLAGTVRNCAGGTTPWGSWISCEEDTSTPQSEPDLVVKPHGYNFEVPMDASGPVTPEPLVAMGRFRHEAIAVDPRSGIIYQTEDQLNGLFYRFIPMQPGNLKAGGKLEALTIPGWPQAVTRTGFPINKPIPVDWVPIEDVDPVADTVRVEGLAKGAAQFSRGEGICSNGDLYFTCTNGGRLGLGQLWRYVPGKNADAGGTLELFLQPENPALLDFPDNLVTTPAGDLMLCEDGRGEQRVMGVTPDGELYPFARNALNGAEFSGICFAPDGQTMFVNIYSPGMTFAIWRDDGVRI